MREGAGPPSWAELPDLGIRPSGSPNGFQGFGPKFHPGYGYGGEALGVGVEGGYPSYGGPGYAHPGPCLNRFGKERPFLYLGGPGYPTPEHPHFFGEAGPLVPDEPVIEIGDGPQEMDQGGGYGSYTGLLPYTESAFAPATTALGTACSAAGVGAPVPPGPPLAPSPTIPQPTPSSRRSLGVEGEPIVSKDGAKCLKVVKVQPGGPAAQAGLGAGDEIRSANEFVTESPENLAWIVTNAAPEGDLRMIVRPASDGKSRMYNINLR